MISDRVNIKKLAFPVVTLFFQFHRKYTAQKSHNFHPFSMWGEMG